jgi:flagellar motor switch protein FliN
MYCIELSEQNHHQLLLDTDSIKALSVFVDGVEEDAELNDESVQKLQASLNKILTEAKLSTNDLSLSVIQELPQSLSEFNGLSSGVILDLEGSKINVVYFISALDADDKVDVANPEFSNLFGDGPSGPTHNMQMLMDVELEVQVELGRKKIKIQDVMSLGKGSVLELDKNAGEPLELYINDTKLAEGEVVVVEDHFGIKITQLISPNERMKSLS